MWTVCESVYDGDGRRVDAGLTVCVMCTDTQMAADTTQIDAE